MIFALLLAAAATQPAAKPAQAELPTGLFRPAREGAEIETALLAPLFSEAYLCGEHKSGELNVTGDALGTDCQIQGWVEGGAAFTRPFRTDGLKNEDWFGWQAAVHAPVTGIVTGLHLNPLVNTPGEMGKESASGLVLRTKEGVEVLLAHIDNPRVKIGDAVQAGDVIATVGNNGMSRNPHIHIGVYKGTTPLQIRWDLRAKLPSPEKPAS